MFIQTDQTPNPLTLKFLPGRVVMEEGTVFYQSESEASDSPLAKRIFDVEGVKSVFLGSDFITITKQDNLDWQVLKPVLLGAITDHYNSDENTILRTVDTNQPKSLNNESDSDIVLYSKDNRSALNTNRILELDNSYPKISLNDGLLKTHNWYKNIMRNNKDGI